MTQIMEDRSLALKESGRTVTVESEQPHFVSLNLDDPLSTGIVLYYLHEGSNSLGRGGEDVEVDIPLATAPEDILPIHCVVEFDGHENVMLHVAEGAFVLVNGASVTDCAELHQGFTVQMGNSAMFRFNHPVEVRPAYLPTALRLPPPPQTFFGGLCGACQREWRAG
jgi:kinesin family protein 16B